MRFDDRLLTVLNQTTGDRHDVAVRWRQLVDLVARAGANADQPVVTDALQTIKADAAKIDDQLRAAAARAIAALPLPLGLLEIFAADRLSVSAPILAAATLESGQWAALAAIADEEARQFIETLHPELRASADLTETLVEQPPAETGEASPSPSLHDVVERIERRRRTRAAMQGRAASDLEPARNAASLFRWECSPNGDIAWVDGAPRGALIGRSIAKPQGDGGDRIDSEILRAFTVRAPFRDASLILSGDGAIAGEWKISGVPAFEPTDGRFAGYRGIALREADVADVTTDAAVQLPDPDSVRELVHEIKTPLNAIMGFAEIIEGQYLGPAERPYRERAQEIVRQARLLLTAIDDLDFAARVHSSAGARPRVNLGELVERVTPALRDLAADVGVQIDASRPIGESMAAAEPELADRLIFRLCSALLEQASAGEHIRLSVEQKDGRWQVAFARPERLDGQSEDELFGGESYDTRFPLRLVRGLARSAGADLAASKHSLALVFPRA